MRLFLIGSLLLFACSDDKKGGGADGPLSDGPLPDGSPSDGHPADTAMTIDSPVVDASPMACASAFAGCSSYTDETANASHTIMFGDALGFSYSPKCLKIRSGQPVTFSGSFASHPLGQGCGPATVITSTSPSGALTFTTTGIYGYYCHFHGDPSGSGMAGSIQVVP
jgi:plastocyanin